MKITNINEKWHQKVYNSDLGYLYNNYIIIVSSTLSKFYMSTTFSGFAYSLCSTWLVWHYCTDLSNLWHQCSIMILGALIFICTSACCLEVSWYKSPFDVNFRKVTKDLEWAMNVLCSCMTWIWDVTRANAPIWYSVACDPLLNLIWMAILVIEFYDVVHRHADLREHS